MSCTQVPGVYWNGYGISPFIWVIYTIRIGGVAALFEVPSSLVVVPVVSSFDNWGFASNFLDAGSLTGDHELLLGGQRNHPVSILNLKRGWNWYSQSVFSFQWHRNIPKPLKVEDWSNLSNWLGICVLRPPLSTSWPWHVRSMICGKENLRRRIREVLAGLGRWSHRSPWIEVHKKHETTSDYFHKMGMHIYIYTLHIHMYNNIHLHVPGVVVVGRFEHFLLSIPTYRVMIPQLTSTVWEPGEATNIVILWT